MKRILCAVVLASLAQGALAADVGVSISIGDPRFYGRLDIGGFPQPMVMYPQPMVIRPAPVHVVREPLYLRVPPGHARKWNRYCGRYNACGYPVYFVQDGWYRDVYTPRYREHHGYQRVDAPPQRAYGYDYGRPDYSDHRRDERRERFNDERGRGGRGDRGERGHGHGHGHGH